MTNEYKRIYTSTLIAALDVATGKFIGSCPPKHRHTEFLKFLIVIENQVPLRLGPHLILDNYATHKNTNVNNWLTNYPLAEPSRALALRTVRQGSAPRCLPYRARPN